MAMEKRICQVSILIERSVRPPVSAGAACSRPNAPAVRHIKNQHIEEHDKESAYAKGPNFKPAPVVKPPTPQGAIGTEKYRKQAKKQHEGKSDKAEMKSYVRIDSYRGKRQKESGSHVELDLNLMASSAKVDIAAPVKPRRNVALVIIVAVRGVAIFKEDEKRVVVSVPLRS